MLPDTQTIPLPLEAPLQEGFEDPRFWLETADFADLAGIERQTAWKALKRCYNGGTWHKTALHVRMVASTGGNSGQAYQVFAPSLPPELSAAWQDAHPELFKAEETEATPAPTAPETQAEKLYRRRLEVADFRLSVILPALRYRHRTRGRTEAIRGICSKTYTAPNGRTVKPCTATICDWLERYETAGGKQGLIPTARTDLQGRRVIISRTFDKASPFSYEEKSKLWENVANCIKSLLSDTFTPLPKVQLLVTAELVRLSKEAGWNGATLENCDIGLNQVRQYKHFRLENIRRHDAQEWSDTYRPRIHRKRGSLRPMDIVMGDVHPVDILKEREDGTTATARMISWYDVATGRYIADYVLCGPRQGITQAHIAASFVKMVKAWGLPRHLYLDNGSEYLWKAMIEGFKNLTYRYPDHNCEVEILESDEVSQILDDGAPEAEGTSEAALDEAKCLTRAKSHNPQGKAPKEGLFGVLERTIFCMIPGWIGGDRMRKKTHKVGKQPRAFDGTWEEFTTAMERSSCFYHVLRQKDGKSPNERNKTAIEAGFTVTGVSEDILFVSLAEVSSYKVKHDGIAIGNLRYFHDYFLTPDVLGCKVTVYSAKWDPSRIGIEKPDGKIIFAQLDKDYGFLEKAGAIEQGRREKEIRKQLREITEGVPKVDPAVLVDQFVALSAPALEPVIVQSFPANQRDQEAVKGGRKQRKAKEPEVIEELGADQFYDESAGKIIDLPPRRRVRDEDDDLPKYTPEQDAAYWKSKRRVMNDN